MVLTRKEFLELDTKELNKYADKAQAIKMERIREFHERFSDKLGSINPFYLDEEDWKKELEKIIESPYLPVIFLDLESTINMSLYKNPKVMVEFLLKKELHNIAKELKQITRAIKNNNSLIEKLLKKLD